MQRTLLRSKIHRATLTGACLHYAGSIAIDPVLMAAADLREFEKVLVANVANGDRFETYVIRGGPGEVGLNGAAARRGAVGDLVIIMAFGLYDDAEIPPDFHPLAIRVDEHNRPLPTP